MSPVLITSAAAGLPELLRVKPAAATQWSETVEFGPAEAS